MITDKDINSDRRKIEDAQHDSFYNKNVKEDGRNIGDVQTDSFIMKKISMKIFLLLIIIILKFRTFQNDDSIKKSNRYFNFRKPQIDYFNEDNINEDLLVIDNSNSQVNDNNFDQTDDSVKKSSICETRFAEIM